MPIPESATHNATLSPTSTDTRKDPFGGVYFAALFNRLAIT